MSFLRNNLRKKLSKYNEVKPANLFIFGSNPDNILTTSGSPILNLTKRIMNQIESMKLTAQLLNLTSLSSTQIYEIDRVFIMHKGVIDHRNSGTYGENWCLKGTQSSDYKAYINPVITHIKKEVEKDFELCASYPFLKVWAIRFREIKVDYLNENFDEVSEVLSNFKARVFQHEYDHIQGIDLLDWRVCQGEIEISKEGVKDYPNFQKALNHYKKVVGEVQKGFPEILNFYEDQKNFGNPQIFNYEKWYKYDFKAFRRQEEWSKEPEVRKALQQAAEIDFNIQIDKMRKEQLGKKAGSMKQAAGDGDSGLGS